MTPNCNIKVINRESNVRGLWCGVLVSCFVAGNGSLILFCEVYARSFILSTDDDLCCYVNYSMSLINNKGSFACSFCLSDRNSFNIQRNLRQGWFFLV